MVGNPDFYPPENRARGERLTARALEVLGNSTKAAVWMRRFDPAVGDSRNTVVDLAYSSEVLLQEALVELDRIAPIIAPRDAPESGWVGKRRSRRRHR